MGRGVKGTAALPAEKAKPSMVSGRERPRGDDLGKDGERGGTGCQRDLGPPGLASPGPARPAPISRGLGPTPPPRRPFPRTGRREHPAVQSLSLGADCPASQRVGGRDGPEYRHRLEEETQFWALLLRHGQMGRMYRGVLPRLPDGEGMITAPPSRRREARRRSSSFAARLPPWRMTTRRGGCSGVGGQRGARWFGQIDGAGGIEEDALVLMEQESLLDVRYGEGIDVPACCSEQD